MSRTSVGQVTLTDISDGENGLPGEDGIDGVRGPGRWNIGVNTLPSNTSEADLAWADGTGVQPDDPIADDQAWFYTGTESSPTSQSVWIYSGTAWSKQEEVISGDLIVNGTITADKINAEEGNFGKLVADIGIFGEIDTGLLDADSVIAREVQIYPEGGTAPTITEDPETGDPVLTGSGIDLKADGDVYIGNFSDNKYLFWDQSAGTMTFRGDLNADDISAGTITADHIAANTITANEINAEVGNFGTLVANIGEFTVLDTDTLNAEAVIAREIQVYPETGSAPTITEDPVTGAPILSGAGVDIKQDGDVYIGNYLADRYIFWDQSEGTLTLRGEVDAGDISATSLSAITANLGTITAGTLQNSGANAIPDADAAPSGDESGAFIDLTDGKFVFGDASAHILWDGTNLSLSGVTIDASSQVDALAGITFQEDGTTFTHIPDGETEAVTTAITAVNLSTNLNGTVNGQTITLTSDDTNDYVDSVSFSGGSLTLGRTGSLDDISVSLDGRYLQAEADTIDTVLGRGNTTSKHLTVNNMTVSGNLTVSGTTTSINTEELNLADNTILLNSNFTGAEPTENAGIEVERGSTESNVALIWNESNSRWSFTNDGSGYHNIPTSSDYDKYESWTVSDGTNTGAISSANTLEFEGTGAVSVSYNDTDKKVTITGTNTTYGVATNAALGLVKIGYTETGKNYPVELNGSNQMYVNVPWVDNNDDTITSVGISGSETTGTVTLTGSGSTTVTQNGSTVTISSTDNDTWVANAVDTDGYVTAPTTTNKNKVWKTDNAGVPAWRDDDNDDTTYSVATDSALGLVKIGFTEDDKNYPVELNESNQMYVNVPWSDNTVTVTSTPTDGDSDKAISSDWAFDNVKTPVPVNAVFTDNDTWVANSVTTDGYVSAPTTSNANKVWKTDDDGVPAWRTDDNDNTTYSNATTTVDGLMSSEDKTKLNGIATNANNYSLPTASADVLGGIKVGSNLTMEDGVLSADSQAYTLPTASPSTLGGIKVGTNLSISDGVLSSTDTTYSAGTLIDIVNKEIRVDLSELTDMTEEAVSTDELVILDSSSQKRKAISEIKLSTFNNDLTGVDASTLGGQESSYYLSTDTTFGGDVSGTYNAISIPGKANVSGDTFTGAITVPEVDFVSPDQASEITATMLDGGTLSFSGSAGQLFSISDTLTGTIFSVNDVSGIPSIEVEDDGTIRLAEYAGNVLIGTDVDDGTSALQVDGTVKATEFDGSLDWTNVANKPTINNDIDYINAASFSTTTGVLTLSGAGNAGATVDLDGRYLTSYTDTNTTYDLSVPASTTKIRLADSNNVNDDVEIAGGSNVTVTRTNANKLTISSSFTNTTYAKATSSVLGLVKIGYSEDGQNYPVELNNDGQMYVNVPWSNTQRAIHDTPEDGATTTSISSNWAFDNVKTAVPANAVFTDTNTWKANSSTSEGYVASGASQANKVWKTDENGVPAWRDDANDNTTYSVATDSVLGLVKIGYTLDATNRNYPVQLSSGKMYVNVPWANTQRPIHDSPVNGATTTSISSNWAFDNVKTAVPANAVFTDTNTVTSVGISGEEVSGIVTVEGSGATTVTQDGSTLTISSTDTNTDTNYYVNSASFSTSTGVITLTGNNASAGATVDIDGRYQYSAGIHARFHKNNGNTGAGYYYLGTFNNNSGFVQLKGTIGSHVETFGTNKLDLSLFAREGNSGTNISIDGTFSVAYQGAGLLVYRTANDGGYESYALYLKVPNYAQIVLDIDTVGLTYEPGAFTTTAPDEGFATEIDTTGYGEGFYKVIASTPELVVDTDTTYSNATTSAAGLMSSTDKTKLNGIATGANNYSLPTAGGSTLGGIKVGTNLSINATGVLSSTDTNTTYTTSVPDNTTKIRLNGSDNSTDDIEIAGGTNVTVTRTSDSKLTISSTDNNTWNANTKTVAGYVSAPGAVGNKVWKTDANGNPGWRDDANTTYSNATTTVAGLMSSTDKTKLNGIDTSANNYSLPTASANELGGIKVGSRLTITNGVLSADVQSTSYSLPTASSTTKGGITVSGNDGLEMDGTNLKLKNHSANFDTITADVGTFNLVDTDVLDAESVIARKIQVYPTGGTAPDISGTTLSGKGAVITQDGDVMIGDSGGKHIFFDESEGTLEITDGSGDDRTEFDGGTIKVYSGGVLRVKIGNLA